MEKRTESKISVVDQLDDSSDRPEKSLSFKFCQFIINRNLLAFSLALLAQTSFLLITAALYFSDSDVLPIDFTDIPLFLFDDASYRRASAWSARNQDYNEPMLLDPSFLSDSEIRQQLIFRQYTADYIELYYEVDESKDENILTEYYLERIFQFEQSLEYLPHYDKFCVLENLGRCQPIDSLLRYLPVFAGNESEMMSHHSMSHHNVTHTTMSHASVTHPNMTHRTTSRPNPNVTHPNDEIWQSIRQLSSNPRLRSIIENYMGLDSNLDAFPPRATKLRSIFRVSWVNYEYDAKKLSKYQNPKFSNHEPINEKLRDPSIPANTKAYAKEILSPAFWNYCINGLPENETSASTPRIRFFYYNIFLYYDRLRFQCWDDEALAFGSLAFIAAFLWFQTRSLFLAAFGMYFILTNFVGGNLIYRYLFDYRYFGVFNALAIFLVLAVGVDEIFVFDETWSATSEHTYPSLAHRLHDCYRKCSLSIFVPTFATAIALAQTAICPLMALSSFGTFAAAIVVLNYFSIVTYFPCVLIFYHTRIDSSCRRRRGTAKGRAQRLSQRACDVYFALLWKPFAQASCLMVTALGLGFLIYSATKLEIDKDPPKLYTDSHLLGASLKKKQNDFPEPLYYRDSQYAQLFMVWGIKDWDRSSCHRNEWKSCNGQIVWDENFDLNPFPAQLDILTICRRLKNVTKDERKDLRIRVGKNGQPEVACFMDEMDSYFRNEMNSLLFEEHKRSGGLPSTQVKVEALMMHVPQIYDMTQLSQNSFFYRYFEIANLYWLNDGYKFLFTNNQFSPQTFKKYAIAVGHSLNTSDLKTARFGNHSFVYGTKLRYVSIVINTTIPRQGLRYDDGLDIFDRWERFFEELKSNIQSPNLRQGGFLIAPDTSNEYGAGLWHWLIVQKTLITSAWQGVLIGVGLALPILILFTDDFLVGTLTTFAIACTSISIIGVIPLAGWKLGLLESLNLTLVADLAIDHIVHVAEGYQLSKKRTRKEKVEELLHEAGISIISGALTTIGASVFLLFAKIVFFMQFGLFILFTVAFSVVYALGMFLVLLALIGPEDDRFSLSKWFKKTKLKLRKTALKYLDHENCDQKLLIRDPGVDKPTDKDDKPNEKDGELPDKGGKPTDKNDEPTDKDKLNGKDAYPTDKDKSTDMDKKMVVKADTKIPDVIFVTSIRSKKSIDDDNVSSGYESTGGAVKKLRNIESTEAEEESEPSTATNCEENLGSFSSPNKGYSDYLTGKGTVSTAPNSRGGINRKIVPIDEIIAKRSNAL